jgi:prolipoprotein diacylglyceryltransferase
MYVIPYFHSPDIHFNGYLIEAWKYCWLLGRIVFIAVVYWETKRRKLALKDMLLITFLSFVLIEFFAKAVFLGARIFLHQDEAYYLMGGWQGLGRVYFGTLLGTVTSVIVGAIITRQWRPVTEAARRYGASNIGNLFDVFMLAHVAGLIFWRLGSFLMHVHIGKPTAAPWGIEYQGTIRHEVSLYEGASMILLFAVAWLMRKRKIYPGFLTLFILGWICLSRLITDNFRSYDTLHHVYHFANGLTLNQIVYAILLAADLAVITLWFYRRGKKIKMEN